MKLPRLAAALAGLRSAFTGYAQPVYPIPGSN
jgi:hypothetical protein